MDAAAHNVDGGLAEFVASVVGEAPLRVEESLGEGFVRLRVSEAERRQAKHDVRWVEDVVIELLRNARDAGAHRIFLATTRSGDERSLLCLDDGAGVPADMHERVFEARVTSKLDTMRMDAWGVHGRGMALYSIRENARSARIVRSAPGRGTALAVDVDCACLQERADQSSWPRLGTDEAGNVAVVRGPHNIARTAIEFALDAQPGNVVVYLGSPAEVVATMLFLGKREPPACSEDEHPLWLQPSQAHDASTLSQVCLELGLDVSGRTAYRLLNGEIEPLEPVLSYVEDPRRRPASDIDLMRDRRGLKLAKDDLDEFAQNLESSFSSIVGERYYLTLKEKPKIRVGRDAITVTFSVTKES